MGAFSVILLSSYGAKTSNSTFSDSSVDSTETVVVTGKSGKSIFLPNTGSNYTTEQMK